MSKLNNFYLFEKLSSVSNFLKSQYNNIFNNPNQALNNLFINFIKKVDTDKNTSILYKNYIIANKTTIQNEINKAESIEEVNKLLLDEIKYFYFSLKPIVEKLQNDEFSIEEIFSKSRDKRLKKLISFPEDKFSNAVQQYVSLIIPEIKKEAGLDEPKEKEPQETTERIRYNINKILEADEVVNEDNELLAYKKTVLNWLNISLFNLIKNKKQLLNQVGAPTNNAVDQLSKKIEATDNENAKKMILNNILNMNKDELKNLALSIGITEEELGQL